MLTQVDTSIFSEKNEAAFKCKNIIHSLRKEGNNSYKTFLKQVFIHELIRILLSYNPFI